MLISCRSRGRTVVMVTRARYHVVLFLGAHQNGGHVIVVIATFICVIIIVLDDLTSSSASIGYYKYINFIISILSYYNSTISINHG